MRSLLPIIFTIFTLHSLSANNPTVGVAMSGGGAKGLYHIGVLEALEHEGVPIDYVAGTSMGAIVAALYAAGYTTDHMRQLALSGELERWALGKLDHNYGYYFQTASTLQSDDAIFSFRIDPRKKHSSGDAASASEQTKRISHKGKKLPQSLIPSLQIDMALSEMFTPSTTLSEGDFSKLMVPFLCVASDVTAAKEHVISSGDLGLAVRASMAIPLAYSPVVTEDGHVLFDGGIYNNLPWKPLKEAYNPDLLIASSCDVEYDDKRSALSITDQIFMLTMNERDYNLPENGVMIDRLVDGGMLDFSRANEIIQMGYDDTMAKIDTMLSIIDLDERLPEVYYSDRRDEFNSQKGDLLIDKVTISGVTPDQVDYTMRLLNKLERKQRRNRGGRFEITFKELRSRLYPALVSGEFATSYPSVKIDTLTDRYHFAMEMSNRPEIKLTIGGNVSSTPFNQIYIGANYNTISRIGKSLFGELFLGPVYNTGRFGYRIDFYYLDAPVFVDLYYNFATKSLNHGSFGNLTSVDNTVERRSRDNYLSLGVGMPIMRRSQISVRGNLGRVSDKGETSVTYYDRSLYYPYSRYEEGQLYYAAARLAIDHNRFNNTKYPTRGELFSASVIGVIGNERGRLRSIKESGDDYSKGLLTTTMDDVNWIGAKVNFAKYVELDRNEIFSFGVEAEGVITSVPTLTTEHGRRLALPYYAPIMHSNMVYMPQFAATRYVAAGAVSSVRFWRDLSVRSQFNAMLSDKYSDDQVVQLSDGYKIETIAQVSIVYVSPIASMSLSLTKYGIEDWNNMYLTFNLGWPIFSTRGIFY